MEEKIGLCFADLKFGSVESIKEAGRWAHGALYHVKTKRRRYPNEFTVYELDGEVKTVYSLQTNKTYKSAS